MCRKSSLAQYLTAHIRQAGEHVLDAGAGLGDAPVAAFLRVRQRLVLAALALDELAPARARQPRLALAVDTALVGQHGTAGVGRVQHVLEVISAGLRGTVLSLILVGATNELDAHLSIVVDLASTLHLSVDQLLERLYQ